MVTGELFLSYKGPGSDRQILSAVGEVTPVPASTVLTSVVDACRELGLKRVVMASPFPADQDARLVRFLEHDEIHVTAYRGLAYENSRVIWGLPPESGLEVARPLLKDNPDVDGLYMPCNKWRITPIIDQLGAGVRQARGDQHPGMDLDGAEGHGAEPARGGLRQAAGSALAGETAIRRVECRLCEAVSWHRK